MGRTRGRRGVSISSGAAVALFELSKVRPTYTDSYLMLPSPFPGPQPSPPPRTGPRIGPRIGVALGGGSARGYAHIGALRSLERHGLAPDVVVGTSFGALVGALYAAGLPTEAISTLANNMRRRDLLGVADFGFHKAALFGGDRLEAYFDTLLESRNFADLALEFAVVTTDVDTGECVLLRRGSLAKALRASVALPGIFAPVEIGGRRLVDGGLGSPVPLATLDAFDVDIAIGIGAGVECSESRSIRVAKRCLGTPLGKRVYEGLRDAPGSHPLRILGRALAHTASSWGERRPLDERALHVQTKPPIGWLNFHKAALAIEAGEAALEAFVPTIRHALTSRHALNGALDHPLA